MSLPETDALARAFLNRSLPKAAWTHAAHLQVALWHLRRYTPEQTLTRLREAIRAYNEATGVVNGPDSGYHESITRFYVEAVARFVAGTDPGRSIDAQAADLVAALGARDLPLRHWSRERLFSVEARRVWVEPDLKPLDQQDSR